jgi:hypothetical protein
MILSSLLIRSIGIGAVLIVSGAGCDGKCAGTHTCPAGAPFTALSATGLPSPLVEISADSPCRATLVPVDGGAASIQVVDDAFNETLTCHVHGRLADGRTVPTTVSFQAAALGCCPGFVATGGDLSLTDAGTDGP